MTPGEPVLADAFAQPRMAQLCVVLVACTD